MATTTAQVQIVISLSSVFVAAVLAYVTYQYYIETKRHTKQMRKNREAEYKPAIKGALVYKHVSIYDFVVVNTGKGAALNIKINWQVDNYPHVNTCAIPHIAPGEQHRFAVQIEDHEEADATEGVLRFEQEFRDELEGEEGILYYEGTCEDALGNIHEFEEEIDIIEAIDGRTSESLEWLQEDEMKQIRKELENIENTLGSIENSIELSGNNSLISEKMTERIYEIVNSHSKVSHQELRTLTGYSSREITRVLRRLEDGNKVVIDSEKDQFVLSNGDATIRAISDPRDE